MNGRKASSITITLPFLFAVFTMLAIDAALASTDDEFLRAGQEVKLRQLNEHLPNITFKKWIDGLVPLGSPAEWEANDCGEATGSPLDTLRDIPVCAQAKIALHDGGTFYMLVAVGTNNRGVHGPPGLWDATIEHSGSFQSFPSPVEAWAYFERQKTLLPGADPMLERVREAVLHAWKGYVAYAWGHDDLNPLSRTPRDWYGKSLLMTPVDAYDTLFLLGFTDEARAARKLIMDRLSFNQDVSVQVFEVTIRLLGGLLTAYQLDEDPSWLSLATDLGTRLLPAFKSPTGMPYRFVNLRTGAVRDSVSNPAEIGTLMLEFGTLGRLTGRSEFYDSAKRAITQLYRRRSDLGLVGSTINVQTGAWVDSTSHVGGGIDSYYEYLFKSFRLFQDPEFALMWKESIRAVNRYLADERFNGLWYGQANMFSGKRVGTEFGSLEAFLPAVLALSGDLDRAGRLMDSVRHMWTTNGVEPEVLDYSNMSIPYPGYELRPESMESAYYLYSLTGEKRYQQMGREMFDAIEKWTKSETGYAALEDVRTKKKRDRMHSFLLAETFKYAYLLFAPPETVDLKNVVFNTEAHPLTRTW